ncbi:hypothetical protein ACOBV8_19155 (plasmid) [Pseudoalteromonas espejiana]
MAKKNAGDILPPANNYKIAKTLNGMLRCCKTQLIYTIDVTSNAQNLNFDPVEVVMQICNYFCFNQSAHAEMG